MKRPIRRTFAAVTSRLTKTGHQASGLGHPLYVNGRLVPEPVTISHVPGATGNYYSVPAGIGLGNVDPSMGAFGAYAAYAPNLPPLGAEEAATLAPAPPPPVKSESFISPFFRLWKYVAPISALASAYHGYKRNDSLGWALWWFLWGGLPITPVIALAQGFGERKGMTPNRERRSRAAKKGARTRASGSTKLWDVIRTSSNTTVTTLVEPAWKSYDQVREEAQEKYGAVYVAAKQKRNKRRRRR
jgi:hypothetical protein